MMSDLLTRLRNGSFACSAKTAYEAANYIEKLMSLLDEIEQAISEFDNNIIDGLDCLDRIDKVLDKREKDDE